MSKNDNDTASDNVVSMYRHADYVRSVVRKAPPITPEQRDRLSALLAVGRASSTAA